LESNLPDLVSPIVIGPTFLDQNTGLSPGSATFAECHRLVEFVTTSG
jgi:hypothetical protein